MSLRSRRRGWVIIDGDVYPAYEVRQHETGHGTETVACCQAPGDLPGGPLAEDGDPLATTIVELVAAYTPGASMCVTIISHREIVYSY